MSWTAVENCLKAGSAFSDKSGVSSSTWQQHFQDRLTGFKNPEEGTALEAALAEGLIEEADYLAWASAEFGLPIVLNTFFTELEPETALLASRKVEWSALFFPISVFDGHLTIAALEMPAGPLPPNCSIALAGREALAAWWEKLAPHVGQDEALEGITLASSSDIAAEAEPDGFTLAAKEVAPLNLSFAGVGLNTQALAEPVADPATDSAPSSDKTTALEVTAVDSGAETDSEATVALATVTATATVSSILVPINPAAGDGPILTEAAFEPSVTPEQNNEATVVSATKTTPVKAAAAPTATAPVKAAAGATPAKATGGIPTAAVVPAKATSLPAKAAVPAKGNAVPARATPVAAASPAKATPTAATAPATPVAVAPAATPVRKTPTLKLHGDPAKRPSLLSPLVAAHPTFTDEVRRALADIGATYEKTMFMALDENRKGLVPLLWTEGFGQPSMPAAVPLGQSSIFEIVATTEKPFHGSVVENDINKRFFDTWNEGKAPGTATLVPVFFQSRFSGVLVAFGPAEAYTFPLLRQVEKAAEELSGQLGGPSAGRAAA